MSKSIRRLLCVVTAILIKWGNSDSLSAELVQIIPPPQASFTAPDFGRLQGDVSKAVLGFTKSVVGQIIGEYSIRKNIDNIKKSIPEDGRGLLVIVTLYKDAYGGIYAYDDSIHIKGTGRTPVEAYSSQYKSELKADKPAGSHLTHEESSYMIFYRKVGDAFVAETYPYPM